MLNHLQTKNKNDSNVSSSSAARMPNPASKSPLGGMLGQLMPMMDQMLGGGMVDSDDDSDSGKEQANDGLEEDKFELSLQQNLSEEEQGRWKSIIEKDEVEQKEMRLPEPFSEAYMALGRTSIE